MTQLSNLSSTRILDYPKNLYRSCKWQILKGLSRGWINRTTFLDPHDITHGQTAESQFPPKRFLGGYQAGDWDLQLISVESHPLYRSYEAHFQNGEPWENTPFFQFALDSIKQGKAFRSEYTTPQALLHRFQKCDDLYHAIEKYGYKSNHQLFQEGAIKNALELRDEVTVNIGRDGAFILNDGWHRFATARMLGITIITVRICAVHTTNKLK